MFYRDMNRDQLLYRVCSAPYFIGDVQPVGQLSKAQVPRHPRGEICHRGETPAGATARLPHDHE